MFKVKKEHSQYFKILFVLSLAIQNQIKERIKF